MSNALPVIGLPVTDDRWGVRPTFSFIRWLAFGELAVVEILTIDACRMLPGVG
ncbi:hypothetical protein FQZ97_736320 [compost metagenome]